MLRATIVALIAFAGAAEAADRHMSSVGPIEVTRMAAGLERPWGFAFLPDGAQIVTERPGRVRIVRDGALSEPLAGVPEVRDEGQGGLLDVALARDFETSRRLYLSFSAPVGLFSAQTAVASARLSADETRLEDVEVIFRQEPAQSSSRHFGSRIVIDPTGALFVTIGDRGEREEAQNPAAHQGSILRLTADGAAHPDNPFVDGARGWKPEIYSYGHRNPQGAAMDADGVLWTVSHGARGGDEINRPEPGKNYGWPAISYGTHYSGSKIGQGPASPGMEQPVHYWDPSIAPSGLAIYEGEMFPEWRGDLLVGALKFRLLSRIDMEDGAPRREERLFEGAYGRIRDVRVAPDGAIWFATDARDGGLYRIAKPSN